MLTIAAGALNGACEAPDGAFHSARVIEKPVSQVTTEQRLNQYPNNKGKFPLLGDKKTSATYSLIVLDCGTETPPPTDAVDCEKTLPVPKDVYDVAHVGSILDMNRLRIIAVDSVDTK
jgi:hypothetical protein